MKQLLCALLLGLGLLVLHAPRAEAHGPGYAVVVHEGRVVRRFRPSLPRWLLAHHGFYRWYVHSRHYRHHGRHHWRHPNWRRLYRLYRKDAAWHRHHGRHHRHRGRCRH